MKIREEDRAAFLAALEKQHALYDEEWKGTREYLARANYHTTLANVTVHGTRSAFEYAAALLATGEEADLKRAEEILWHAASLQDKDPSNKTYGIWSWYMEEPLDKMSPPDWNWADFCGKGILQVLEFHADRISHALYMYLADTLRHACLSIYRRNMTPDYTNISIMGSYVTLHAGQLLDWPWLFDYGKRRFEKSVHYTRENGGAFAEYNSATYTAVAIEDLTRIKTNVRDPEVKAMAEEMLHDAWQTVSSHFHAPTRQWCGPNARSYTWLTANNTLSFLEQALGHEVKLASPFVYQPAWAYVDLCCPEEFRGAFRASAPHDDVLSLTTGPDIHAPADNTAFMHMEEEYVLSSWAVTSTWNQRRNLLGFWGGEKTRFVSATILHDLYDFSSGMFTTAQSGGHALVTADLVDNGGDTHCNLDLIKNRTIRGYDLRVRIEIGGETEGKWNIAGDTAEFRDGDMTLCVKLLGAEFEGRKCAFSTRESGEEQVIIESKPDLHRRFVGDETRRYLDVVFYEGDEREIDLGEVGNAFVAFFFSMDGVTPQKAELALEKGSIMASVDDGEHILAVHAPASPLPTRNWNGKAFLDGEEYRDKFISKT
ncbi:MAG: hypothetical protein MJ141_03375 [Clostridia bacterium]|nr:hypothetical protein [Clostridia bacterium]